MAGYSQTPLWKKLGYKAGARAFVANPPAHYRALLTLPADQPIVWIKPSAAAPDFVHAFVTRSADLKRELARYRRWIVPSGAIWISWPKKASGVATDITEDTVREHALPLGLVDIKVCAVDDTWSGLKLVIRKALRSGALAAADA